MVFKQTLKLGLPKIGCLDDLFLRDTSEIRQSGSYAGILGGVCCLVTANSGLYNANTCYRLNSCVAYFPKLCYKGRYKQSKQAHSEFWRNPQSDANTAGFIQSTQGILNGLLYRAEMGVSKQKVTLAKTKGDAYLNKWICFILCFLRLGHKSKQTIIQPWKTTY